MFAKKTYGRGAGFLPRSEYRGIFFRYIRDHRNVWMPIAKPLSELEKAYLKRFFPARIVERVRVTELVGMTGAFILNAAATTYGNDFIIVRKGSRSLSLLKHELVHACQYDRLGGENFAYRYADQFVDGGYEYREIEFEKQAYAFQQIPDGSTPHIAVHLGYCDR